LVDDVLSGVDELVRLGISDQKRLGLIGFSNGGGSVNQLVTKTDRFQYAVSASGAAVDWSLAFLLNSDTTFYPRLLGDIGPWDSPNEYTAVSPIYRLNKVKIPILLAIGDREPNEFVLPMIEMYNGLRYLKRDVTFFCDTPIKDTASPATPSPIMSSVSTFSSIDI
jgi:dipeptidyl aminopeptidase/acylaminoacyl peptidase